MNPQLLTLALSHPHPHPLSPSPSPLPLPFLSRLPLGSSSHHRCANPPNLKRYVDLDRNGPPITHEPLLLVMATDSSPPTRIPKLKYRNPLPANRPSSSSSRDPTRKTSSPAADTASTLSRPSFETASLTSPSLASTHSSNGSWSDSTSATKKKKKTSSVLGFLSLKEPSQVALEQFAQQQRKQGSAKGKLSSANSTKAGSINSKKLPPSVPKVNSKWDGSPSPARNRNSTSTRSSSDSYTLSTQDSRTSTPASMRPTDSRLSVMSSVSQNPPNSIASPMASMLHISDQQPAHYVPQPPPVITQHDASYYSPDEPLVLPVSLASSPKPGMFPGTIVGSSPSFPFSPTPLDTPLDEYEGSRSPSPALSTDSTDTIVRGTADAIFKKLNDRPHQNYAADQLPERSTDEHDPENGSVPESHDFLFDIPPTEQLQHDSPMASPPVPHYTPRRPMRNFSRLMNNSVKAMPPPPPPPPAVSTPSSLRLKPASPGLPTLYEGSVASTESLETVRDNSDAQSVAASSIAPSVLSEQWYQNPRDRLGLGGRLRKGDAPRWKTIEEPQGKPKKNLLSFLVRSRS
jgi:hypothetical protein